MGAFSIEIVDPRTDEVRAVVARHLAFAHEHSPPHAVHALDVSSLVDPAVTVFGYRAAGTLLGIGALKELAGREGEIKSMHTLAEARGRGVGGALVDQIVSVARDRGLVRLNLETGAQDAFRSAWSVYESRGFIVCGPFSDYAASVNSRFMTLALTST